MNRIKSAFAIAAIALSLTANASAAIGGTDPEPRKPKKPALSMDVATMIQIAISGFGL